MRDLGRQGREGRKFSKSRREHQTPRQGKKTKVDYIEHHLQRSVLKEMPGEICNKANDAMIRLMVQSTSTLIIHSLPFRGAF